MDVIRKLEVYHNIYKCIFPFLLLTFFRQKEKNNDKENFTYILTLFLDKQGSVNQMIYLFGNPFFKILVKNIKYIK